MTQKFTAEEVRKEADFLSTYSRKTSRMLAAYADTLSKPADSGRVGDDPVALAVFVPGDNTTGNMRIWTGKTDSVHMFLEAHGLPSHTQVTPLYTHPASRHARQVPDDLWQKVDRMIVDAWKLGGCKETLDMLDMRRRFDEAAATSAPSEEVE